MSNQPVPSTLVRAITRSLNFDVEVIKPSVDSPIASRSASLPRNLADTVFHMLPTRAGSCSVVFVPVINAIASDKSVLAA